MYRYDLLEPDKDYSKSMDKFQNTIAELYVRAWMEEKEAVFKKPFSLNLLAFMELWFAGSMKIYVGYKDDKPAGFLLGMVFRPLPYAATVFQVEDWFTDGDGNLERGLFAYAIDSLKFLKADEIWVADKLNREPMAMNGWNKVNEFQYRRFVRE